MHQRIVPAGVGNLWDRLRAAWETAVAAAEEYHAAHYTPARSRLDEAVGPLPPCTHVITATSGRACTYKIDINADWPPFPAFDPLREKQQALRDWFARSAECERHPDWVEASRQMDALWEVEDAARSAMMTEPAPDGTAFALKVQLALGNDEMWDSDREALLSDLARLV